MGRAIANWLAIVILLVLVTSLTLNLLLNGRPFQYDLTPGASFVVGEPIGAENCAGVTPVAGGVIPRICADTPDSIAKPKLFGLAVPFRSPNRGWIRIGADAVRVGCPFDRSSPCTAVYVASNRFVTDRCASPETAYAGFGMARLNYRQETECGRAALWPSQCKWIDLPFKQCAASANYNIIAGRSDALP